MKALDNRFYVRFMRLEIGLLTCDYTEISVLMLNLPKYLRAFGGRGLPA